MRGIASSGRSGRSVATHVHCVTPQIGVSIDVHAPTSRVSGSEPFSVRRNNDVTVVRGSPADWDCYVAVTFKCARREEALHFWKTESMAHSHIIDGYTSEDDRAFLEEFDMCGVCDDCGGPNTGYCFCCVSEGSEELESMRRMYAHEVAQAQGRVSKRAARENMRKFCIKVKVMLIANYWFFLTLRPGADAAERAQKRFCAACEGSQC